MPLQHPVHSLLVPQLRGLHTCSVSTSKVSSLEPGTPAASAPAEVRWPRSRALSAPRTMQEPQPAPAPGSASRPTWGGGSAEQPVGETARMYLGMFAP